MTSYDFLRGLSPYDAAQTADPPHAKYNDTSQNAQRPKGTNNLIGENSYSAGYHQPTEQTRSFSFKRSVPIYWSYIVDNFNKSPLEYTYEPEQHRNQRVQEIAEGQKITTLANPSDARSEIIRFERSTGTSLIFYRGEVESKAQSAAGFVKPENPDFIFINATSDLQINVILAHEWTHVAQKDEDSGYNELDEKIFSLLTDKEKDILQKNLEARDESYKNGNWKKEVLPYFMGDAVSGEDFFGLQLFENAEEIKQLLSDFYHQDFLRSLSPYKESHSCLRSEIKTHG